jgi:hypothetical protein
MTTTDLRHVDLDDTTGCPTAERCEICGSDWDIATATAGTRVGVFCLRTCAPCVEKPLPSIRSWLQASERVAQHCDHLGISLDDMAALLARDERRGGGR